MKRIFTRAYSLLMLAVATIAAVLPIATVAAASARVYEILTTPSQWSPAVLGANTLTGIIPTLYEALNRVSREMVGFIPAVTRDSKVERAALNQTVRSPVGTSGALEDVTPAVTPPTTGDTTVDYVDITITKSKAAPIKWNGEETLAVGSTGVYNMILADQFAEGMRKLVNAIEIDLAVQAKVASSRAYGTAGTAPFGTAGDLSDFAGALRILEENGAPKTDLQMVLGSAAWFNLRGKQSTLFKVNESGSAELLRTGLLTERVEGFALRSSGGIVVHTKGTGSAYATSGSTAVDVSDIALVTGTGTVLAGDVVTFAADTANKYVVRNGVAAPGTISLNKPGARIVIPTANAMTVGNSYTPNVAFARSALVLATRAPALPQGGDMADDAMMLVDPVTGLAFEVRVYRGYRQVRYEVAMAWGTGYTKAEHIATLIG